MPHPARWTGGNEPTGDHGVRPTRTVLATAGDRLVLQNFLWRGDADGEISEVETLEIDEVNAEGRIIPTIVFDPDEVAAAQDEMQ